MPSCYITVRCPHNFNVDDGADECGCENEIEVDYEPEDSNYGADADGNRGMYVSGYAIAPYYHPDYKCAEGCELTAEETVEWERRAKEAADEYEPPTWEPGDDY